MGLFDRFKAPKVETTGAIEQMNWNILDDINQLATIKDTSQTTPVLIFKHSTTCGISRMVLRNLESEYDIDAQDLIPYFLDLKQYREISNAIASQFNVVHESPQILLVKCGEAVYNTSHGSITVEKIKKHL